MTTDPDPGDIAERRDRPGYYVAVISAPIVEHVMVVPIAVSEAFAASTSSPFHTIGTEVQGYLIPTLQRMYRIADLGKTVDTVEAPALANCRKLFQVALQ